MGKIETQLPLPGLRVPSKGRVSVFIGFKDIATDPKILMARRPNGLYTFPGGKAITNEKPVKTALREVFEETRWKILSSELAINRIINGRETVRVAASGAERNFSIFYGFVEECLDDEAFQHIEPDKNTPWEWISVNKIPSMVLRGELHPLVIKADIPDIVYEAQNGIPYLERNTVFIDPRKYDFPHYGLHSF